MDEVKSAVSSLCTHPLLATWVTIVVVFLDLLILPAIPKGAVSASQVGSIWVRLLVFLICLPVGLLSGCGFPFVVLTLLLYKSIKEQAQGTAFSPRHEPYTGMDDKLPKEVCTITPDYHCEHPEVSYESQFLPQYVPGHAELGSTPEPSVEEAAAVDPFEKGSYYEWN